MFKIAYLVESLSAAIMFLITIVFLTALAIIIQIYANWIRFRTTDLWATIDYIVISLLADFFYRENYSVNLLSTHLEKLFGISFYYFITTTPPSNAALQSAWFYLVIYLAIYRFLFLHWIGKAFFITNSITFLIHDPILGNWTIFAGPAEQPCVTVSYS